MESTNNFDLNLYEGTDKFNPLLVENENMEIIDSTLYQLMLKTCEPATEIKSGSVHAITRSTGEAPLFRYTATSNWTAGDTMTIDGTQVSVFLTSGEALGTGAYVIGTEVLGAIVGTRVTLFCVSGTVSEAENALNLDGHPADYFGTAEGVQSANALATAANQISIANQQSITQLTDYQKKNYIQRGISKMNAATSSTQKVTVNFDITYKNIPTVIFSISGNTGYINPLVFNKSTSSAEFFIDGAAPAAAYYAEWCAIGEIY